MEPEIEDIPTRRARNKLIKESKEKERLSEKDYVPLIKPKNTIEISVKPPLSKQEIEHFEKSEFKKIKQPSKKGKTSKPFKPGKRKLSGNAVLIITEKPQAAAKISAALSDGNAKSYSGGQGVSYYEFEKQGQEIIVSCAVGHLFSLSQNIKGSDYPIFDIGWKPNFEVRKKDFTRKYYNNLSKLIKRAKEIIIATDYDVEGEVIGYNIVRFIGGQEDAKRMKFSSLTAEDIKHSYNNLSPTINWGHAIAGETRHYLDWYYGINLSRALMNSIKSSGKFKIMSIGRVQGPALNLIVEREKEIQAFKPETFWRVFINVVDKKDPKNELELKHTKDLTDKKELEKFEKLKNKEADVSTNKSEQIIPPPAPFDLTTLQTESYKFFSITPVKTLQIAQQLYLSGVISYPRTSSQKIPQAINPKNILKRLSSSFKKEVEIATRNEPIEGSKLDPAHPSIYPTGEFQELGEDEKKIYDLIARRFIACFCQDAKIENKTITAEIDKLKFKARGVEIKEKAWMDVYKTKLQEVELKDMNGKAIIKEVRIQEDQTKPSKRYSPASIISELEKRGLGTKATRANIVETLYNRNYVSDNRSIRATSLGINLIDTLGKYSSIIIDEKLTRDMEKDTEEMQTKDNSKELKVEQEKVLNKAKKGIEKISKTFHSNQEKIGKELIKATETLWKEEAKENTLDFKCPKCNKGKLMIKYSPRFKRQFIACDAYPECKTTYSLPPNGKIKKTEKFCEHCKFPMMMRLSKGKRPWIFCFNPECVTRQQKQEDEGENKNE